MPNIYMEPAYPNADRGEGGIRRVVEAMTKHLPDFGWNVVSDIARADLTAGHGVMQPRRHGLRFVSHNHGLYWQEYNFPRWAHEVNAEVIRAMKQADAVTVPSKWVAGAITRGMLVRPHVVYHGVDVEDWQPGVDNDGYVLWNKARTDPVSNADHVVTLAQQTPDVQYVSTFGPALSSNFQVIGHTDIRKMKQYVRRAGVYLATARETFGVGTLEALACGVPVAGWDYGGQSEIIVQGETGYLAPFGDYKALAECVRKCLNERARLSENARADAVARWQWPDKIAQYAQIYDQVLNPGHYCKVSVIVTCHNLGHFLPAALDSVKAQTFQDWECLIVDDASTDNTREIAIEYTENDARFVYCPTDRNRKLPGALNFGAELARGEYIISLDADNLLPPDALMLLARELDARPDLSIVYGALETMTHDGREKKLNSWPSGFNWLAQMAHLNQIHSSAMMRRRVWVETGGWRERCWRAEDAEYWCRATSFGYSAAQVTDKPTLIYRVRSDSKGALEAREHGGDGDWTAWYPWRVAGTPQRGHELVVQQRLAVPPNAHMVPFAAQGQPPRERFAWDVHHHQEPLVSVIIPVGPGHERLVIDALDSLVAQNFGAWEAVVVNATGHALDEIPGAPYARIIETENTQTGAARNAGLRAARGALVYFLDADDYLAPGDSLRRMVMEYARGEAAYIYTDYVQSDGVRDEQVIRLPEYDQNNWRMFHATNVLMAREHAIAVGGFDETLIGWEDWDFFAKLATRGYCGKRLAHPAFVYRRYTGQRRDSSLERQQELLAALAARYKEFYDGGRPMSKCCGGGGDAILAAKRAIDAANRAAGNYTGNYWLDSDASGVSMSAPETPGQAQSGITPETVRMEFTGENVGAITFFGDAGRKYRGGANAKDKYHDVHRDDVAKLVSTGRWRIVGAPPQEPAPVEPEVKPTADEMAGALAELLSDPAQLSMTPETNATTDIAPVVDAGDAPSVETVEIVPVVEVKKKRRSKKHV